MSTESDELQTAVTTYTGTTRTLFNLLAQLKVVLEKLSAWAVVVDAPQSITNPTVANTAATSTTGTFSITQTGTVDGWNVYLKAANGTFPTQPNQTVAYSGSPTFSLSSLQPLTQYDVGTEAFDGVARSGLTVVRFETSADTTIRVVAISSSMKATAISAAGAAGDGSKNNAYTNSIDGTLATGEIGVICDRDGPTDLHTEVLTISHSATALTVAAAAASFTSSTASNPASYDNLWFEIRKSGSPTVLVSIPAGTAAQADPDDPLYNGAKYVISGAWGTNEQVTRTSDFVCAMPSPAFDSVSSGGSGTAGALSVADLAAHIGGPYENSLLVAGSPTGLGARTGGFIQMIRPTYGGLPAYDNTFVSQSANFGAPLLPWLVLLAATTHQDDGTGVVELWDFDFQVFKTSVGSWQRVSGYQTNTMQLAWYYDGSVLNASNLLPPKFTLSNGHEGYVMPSSPEIARPNGSWMTHNSVGSGAQVTGTDIKSYHLSCMFKLAQRPGASTLNSSIYKLLIGLGCDAYPNPYPGGYIVPGNQSNLLQVTTSARRLSFTMFKDNAGLCQIYAPKDSALSATWPPDQTWLAANKPIGVT